MPVGILYGGKRKHDDNDAEQKPAKIGKYGRSNEPYEAFLEASFQDTLNSGLDLAQSIMKRLLYYQKATDGVAYVEDLISVAQTLSAFECTETRTIAVLGDSGEGKAHYLLYQRHQHL